MLEYVQSIIIFAYIITNQKTHIMANLLYKNIENLESTIEQIIGDKSVQLTENQTDSINKLWGTWARTCETRGKNSDARFQRYMDCQDDYSFGGLCDQASDSQSWYDKATLLYGIEEVIFGGVSISSTQTFVVDAETGEELGAGCVKGKYGECVKLSNGSWLGEAKRISTYTKKGYILKNRDAEFTATFGGWSKNNNSIWKNVVLVNETITESTDGQMKNGNSIFWWAKQSA